MQTVKVTTAFELSAQHTATIEKTLTQKLGGKPTFEYQVDPQVIGGIKLTIGSRELDGTIKAKLTQLRDRLSSQA